MRYSPVRVGGEERVRDDSLNEVSRRVLSVDSSFAVGIVGYLVLQTCHEPIRWKMLEQPQPGN